MSQLKTKLIRLASSFPAGSAERTAILKVLASKPEALARALEKFLKDKQKESGQEMGPAWGPGGKYDPFADTVVWVGEKAQRKAKAPVALVYDGAGYDYLSYRADYGGLYRKDIERIARKHGFHMEDLNSWSMGFWPA